MEGRRMTVELFHDQSPRKYGTGPGSNSRPLDHFWNINNVESDRMPLNVWIVRGMTKHTGSKIIFGNVEQQPAIMNYRLK